MPRQAVCYQRIQTGLSPEMANADKNRRFLLGVCPWNFTDDIQKQFLHPLYITSNFVQHFKAMRVSPKMLNSGQNWRFFVPHDLEIWWMTLKNNRPLCSAALSFVHHVSYA